MSADERRKLSEDERRLWGRITGSIAPLRRKPVPLDRNEPTSTAAKSSPLKSKPLQSARSRIAGGVEPTAPKPAPQIESLDRRTKQRLARGAVEIEGRLDLHGRTQSEAHVALLRFLRRAQADGNKFVLVITGKGARASDHWSERGVLKRQVPLWLKQAEFRAYVSGFEDAHVGHGGEGALYVRVRRPR
jgi:DNA-nicking Smr family endonuclease